MWEDVAVTSTQHPVPPVATEVPGGVGRSNRRSGKSPPPSECAGARQVVAAAAQRCSVSVYSAWFPSTTPGKRLEEQVRAPTLDVKATAEESSVKETPAWNVTEE